MRSTPGRIIQLVLHFHSGANKWGKQHVSDTCQGHTQLAVKLGGTLMAGLAGWSPMLMLYTVAWSARQCGTALEGFTAST